MEIVKPILAAIIAIAMLVTGGAAMAQEAGEAEIDALISATESDEGALAAARQQVSSGNLSGAAATLQRSLLIRPGAQSDEVRLYYGVILCRLGDQTGGARQLSMVRTPDAPGWTEARQACGLSTAGRPGQGDSFSGMLAFGLGYESDAFGAFVSQIAIPGVGGVSEDGWSINANAAINARFSTSPGGHAYAGGALRTRTDISGLDLDYLVADGRFGYVMNVGGDSKQMALGVLARHAQVFGDPFLNEYGLEAEYRFSADRHSRWTVAVEAVAQDYRSGLLATARDGARWDLALSYRSVTGVNRAWTAGVALEIKEAEAEQFGYRGWRAFAASQWPVRDNGSYFAASGVIRYADYNDAPLVTDRQETRTFVRAAYGVPLAYEGLAIEAAVSHSSRSYNDTSLLRDYDSFGAELRLVYRFGG